jgi:AbrB family looped-hinge helix DNA binding protein
MTTLVGVDKTGRLVLPKPIRNHAGLEAGGVVTVSNDGDRIVLTPLRKRGRKLKKVGGFIVAEATGKHYEAVEAIAALRQERG